MARPKKLQTEPIAITEAIDSQELLVEASGPEITDEPTGYNVGLMGPSTYTGEALSLVCFDNQGFRNFKIAKMKIEKGKVIAVEYGDPYASFEAVGFLEMLSQFSVMKCGNDWKHGKSWVISDGKF